MALKEGNKKEAMRLYTKCLSYDKNNLEIHYKRLQLAEEVGRHFIFLFVYII